MATARNGHPRELNAILLMLEAGLRVSEAAELPWEDIDFARALIHVAKHKTDARIVPVPINTIIDLQRNRGPGWWAIERLRDPRSLQHLSTRQVHRLVLRAQLRTELPPWARGCHILRHTYATQLNEEGFSTRYIQELLGHVSLRSTQVYVHVSLDQLTDRIRARPRAPAQLALLA